GIKEATLKIAGKDVKVAVAHGAANAKALLEKIKAGEHYDFVEMMACPGGCIHGGGQPVVDAYTKAKIDVKAERAKALYTEDERATLRKSHENPVIQKLYADFLGEPCGHKSHELLHTHYTDRSSEK
ncbi:MAG: iron hydrogenase small subunit, partial [Clostridia bacterium]|nr:iron hydrogenase small subunit [Clostridia bacterium]